MARFMETCLSSIGLRRIHLLAGRLTLVHHQRYPGYRCAGVKPMTRKITRTQQVKPTVGAIGGLASAGTATGLNHRLAPLPGMINMPRRPSGGSGLEDVP